MQKLRIFKSNYMRTAVVLLSLIILGLSCKDNNNPVKTQERRKTDGGLMENKSQKIEPEIGIILETENIKLYGDTTINKSKISYAVIKFEPYICFEYFKVSKVDNKKYAALDLKSNQNANKFRTRLKEAYDADTANFAGHYSFVYWGCGSPCQSSLVIDRTTGKIYDAPVSSLGYDFRVDSRMLIINPPDTNGFYGECIYCKPVIYIFEERTKTFKERLSR